MKERGHLLIPIAFLLYMLIWSGRTVIFSAFWTTSYDPCRGASPH